MIKSKTGASRAVKVQDRFMVRHRHVKRGVKWADVYPKWAEMEETFLAFLQVPQHGLAYIAPNQPAELSAGRPGGVTPAWPIRRGVLARAQSPMKGQGLPTVPSFRGGQEGTFSSSTGIHNVFSTLLIPVQRSTMISSTTSLLNQRGLTLSRSHISPGDKLAWAPTIQVGTSSTTHELMRRQPGCWRKPLYAAYFPTLSTINHTCSLAPCPVQRSRGRSWVTLSLLS